MLRFSLFLILSLPVSVSADQFNEALIAYGDRLEYCSNIARKNIDPFPKNEWFNALTGKQQKNIFLFISTDNRFKCLKGVRARLLEVLSQENSLRSKATARLIDEDDHHSYIEGMDLNKIKEIQEQYSEPFNFLIVGDSMGW